MSWVTLVLFRRSVSAALVKLPASTTRANACMASNRSMAFPRASVIVRIPQKVFVVVAG